MSKIVWRPGTLVAPVPPVMVTCGTMEHPNIITVAWTGNICSDPAKAYISVRPERYSYGLIRESGEYAINLTTSALARAVGSETAPWASRMSRGTPRTPAFTAVQ